MEDSLNKWIMKVEEQVNLVDERVHDKPTMKEMEKALQKMRLEQDNAM